ncbi:alpha/beta hydrolase domain-containing protein [Noviherbaspirillum sp. CPCC 100848]|uniref:Alpha/beta hydrolase domain-containing protein n=1 Tax=Noviherbaspirillum album TaxID=3080276 RepID=A0ABU6JGF6_9BURK|nr:alpha/beta hydrolase domain-containing protein [Noviherbaspirillum sp. CPCC 100848]MEC4722750.1 alpha/beta hydrolase domain-containing protein [Noviherbaspirillum sp. CPCC 100848]
MTEFHPQLNKRRLYPLLNLRHDEVTRGHMLHKLDVAYANTVNLIANPAPGLGSWFHTYKFGDKHMKFRLIVESRTIVSAAVVTALLGASLCSLPAQAQSSGQRSASINDVVSTPQVTGPIAVNSTPGAGTARDYPFFVTEPQFDLALAGYVEEEFFVQGTATRYQTPTMADAVATSSGHPYKTRIVVRRPVDAKKFNGVVLVEWANVTSGYGIDLHWQYSREYLTREGYVVVRVDAQRVGVHQERTGLKDWSPTRYGSLDVTAGGSITDDSLSYDIFSQVIKAIKVSDRDKILKGLVPSAVLAVGQSQSAGRLTLYYNSIQPKHHLVDGFLIQVLGGPFRTDVRAPMMRIISETELMLYGLGATRQPDSPTLREWEIAGAAHVDYWWVQYRQGLAVRDKMTPPSLGCDPEPGSHVPLRYVLNAGYHHLSRWVLNGIEPPRAEPITMTSVNPPMITRDVNGLAYGGIRQAEVEVPTATNRGDQIGMTPGCPNNYGMHVPFNDAKLSQLYRSNDAYVQAVTTTVRKNVREGFILKDDAEEIIRRAASSNVGTGRAVSIR